MVQVRMLDTLATAVDGLGVRVETLAEGEVYDVIERVAERLVGRGAAEVVFPDETPEEAEAEAEAPAEVEAPVEVEVEAPVEVEVEAPVEVEVVKAEVVEAPVGTKPARGRSKGA